MRYLYVGMLLSTMPCFAMEEGNGNAVSPNSSMADMERSMSENQLTRKPSTPEASILYEVPRAISVEILVNYIFPPQIDHYDFNLTRLSTILSAMPVDFYNKHVLKGMPVEKPEKFTKRPLLAHRFQVLRVIISYLYSEKIQKDMLEYEGAELKEELKRYVTKAWDNIASEQIGQKENEKLQMEVILLKEKLKDIEEREASFKEQSTELTHTEMYKTMEEQLHDQETQSSIKRYRLALLCTSMGYITVFAGFVITAYYALKNMSTQS